MKVFKFVIVSRRDCFTADEVMAAIVKLWLLKLLAYFKMHIGEYYGKRKMRH